MPNKVGYRYQFYLVAVAFDDDKGLFEDTAVYQMLDREDVLYLLEGYHVPDPIGYLEAMDRGGPQSIDPRGRTSGIVLCRRFTPEELASMDRPPSIPPHLLPMLPLDGDKAGFRPSILNDDFYIGN